MLPTAGVAEESLPQLPEPAARDARAEERIARGQPRSGGRCGRENTVTRPSEVASTISWRPSPLRSASWGEDSPELPSCFG